MLGGVPLGVTSRGEDEKDWRATMVRFESVGEVIVMYRLIGGLGSSKSLMLYDRVGSS